jgi:ABC-type transport system substrate-binding protein
MKTKQMIPYLARIIIAGTTLCSLLILPAMGAEPWAKWDYTQEKPVRGGYYRSAATQDVGLMNPNHWPVNNWSVIAILFDKLFSTDGSYREVPWMVESFEFSGPLMCTFKLKEGITFTDGTPFNAAALKYQLEWILDKKNGAWSKAWLAPLKSMEITDEHTIRFYFSEPWGSFLGILASVPGYAMSPASLKADILLKETKKASSRAKTARKKAKKALKKAKKAEAGGGEKAKKALKKAKQAEKKAAKAEKKALALKNQVKGLKNSDVNPVGTSAYMLEKHRPGTYTRVKRNPNWWFGKSVGYPDMPYFDGQLITVIPDASIQMANFRAGKLDSLYVEKSHYQQLVDDPKSEITVNKLNWSMGLRFNHARAPFKDIRVRKAISHAIDRHALVAGIEFGLATVSSSFFPDDHWAHNPFLKPVKYDLELSKKLLAEAGYADGLTIKGHMYMTPSLVNLTDALRGMLKKAGIDWKVDNISPAASSDRVKNLEYDLAQNIYFYMFEPDLCVTNFYHPDGGWNFGRTNNKRVIELIEEGRKEVDWKKRQSIYWDIEKELNNNYEDVYLYWPTLVSARPKNVRGFVFKGGYQEFGEVWGYSHPLWFKEGRP